MGRWNYVTLFVYRAWEGGGEPTGVADNFDRSWQDRERDVNKVENAKPTGVFLVGLNCFCTILGLKNVPTSKLPGASISRY